MYNFLKILAIQELTFLREERLESIWTKLEGPDCSLVNLKLFW